MFCIILIFPIVCLVSYTNCFKDVNNNRPVFTECAQYSRRASVPEGKHPDLDILQVLATDQDSGLNGQISYNLYHPEGETHKPFVIDAASGMLRASPYVEFDREERAYEHVTVTATDKGDRPLLSFCNFTVQVSDSNDNMPAFDRYEYESTISRSMTVGTSVITVFADDRDSCSNAHIVYSLAEEVPAGPDHQGDKEFFLIRPISGEIVLLKTISHKINELRFLVNVTDNGFPPLWNTAGVYLKISDSKALTEFRPMDDCLSEKIVKENIPQNAVLFRCCAQTTLGTQNGAISYTIRNGAKPKTNTNIFRVFQQNIGGADCAQIRNMKNLDYEQVKKYDLTLTALDMSNKATLDKKLTIVVEDVNDNVPKFKTDRLQGFVMEEVDPPVSIAELKMQREIAMVKAEDCDSAMDGFNKIEYSIMDGPHAKLFVIDKDTGKVWANARFDREKNDSLIIEVEARDSATSSLPGSTGPNKDKMKLQILIKDMNDNVPYFPESLYRVKVDEDLGELEPIMRVKAHDDDHEAILRYSLAEIGNHESKFGMRPKSGQLFLREPLDYEKTEKYHLTVIANDGVHTASTTVDIEVGDVNDNAPQFNSSLYSLTILEKNADNRALPLEILSVEATDRESPSRQIRYKLFGQGADDYFKINNNSGRIFLQKKLDRVLQNRVNQWNLIVQAKDEDGKGLAGYADVVVNLGDISYNRSDFNNGTLVY